MYYIVISIHQDNKYNQEGLTHNLAHCFDSKKFYGIAHKPWEVIAFIKRLHLEFCIIDINYMSTILRHNILGAKFKLCYAKCTT